MPKPARKAILRLGDVAAASVETFGGGEPYCEVINEPGGLLPYAKKHLGELKFADLDAEVSMDADESLYRWIRDAWFGNPVRERVALEAADGRLELANVSIRDVVLPALDTASHEYARLGLRVAPRAVRRASARPVLPARDERPFISQNFTFALDGLDCRGVMRIDPATVHLELDGRAQLVFPDLHLHVDVTQADAFYEWFEDFVIAGNNDDDKERDGAITYFDPLLTEALGVLHLFHAGIYRIADDPPPVKGPRTVRVDLYCERMELSASGRAATGTTDMDLQPVRVT